MFERAAKMTKTVQNAKIGRFGRSRPRSKPVTNITFVELPALGTAITRGESTWIVVGYDEPASVIYWQRQSDGVVRFSQWSFDPRDVLTDPKAGP